MPKNIPFPAESVESLDTYQQKVPRIYQHNVNLK